MTLFRDLARAGGVKQPTQRGFNLSSWNTAFSKVSSPDESDHALYAAGIWFFNRLQQVRSTLAEFDHLRLPSGGAARLQTAVTNFVIASLNEEFYSRINMVLAASEDDQGNKTVEVTPPATLVSRVEGMVEASRFCIAAAIRDDQHGKSDGKVEDLEALTKARVRLQTAGLYHTLEALWGECLWNGWQVKEGERFDAVVAPDSPMQWTHAVGAFRREKLVVEFADHSIQLWRRSSPSFRRALVEAPRIRGIARVGKRKVLELGPGLVEDGFPPPELMLEVAAKELYLHPFLNEPLSGAAGLTLNQIIAAWAVLAPLGRVVEERYPRASEIDKVQHALAFAPVFGRGEIESVLRRALSVPLHQAQAALALFSFESERDDLWQRPFVPVGHHQLTFISSALSSPNLLRSLEAWMRIQYCPVKSRRAATGYGTVPR